MGKPFFLIFITDVIDLIRDTDVLIKDIFEENKKIKKHGH
jgi:hypothetical protein